MIFPYTLHSLLHSLLHRVLHLHQVHSFTSLHRLPTPSPYTDASTRPSEEIPLKLDKSRRRPTRSIDAALSGERGAVRLILVYDQRDMRALYNSGATVFTFFVITARLDGVKSRVRTWKTQVNRVSSSSNDCMAGYAFLLLDPAGPPESTVTVPIPPRLTRSSRETFSVNTRARKLTNFSCAREVKNANETLLVLRDRAPRWGAFSENRLAKELSV